MVRAHSSWVFSDLVWCQFFVGVYVLFYGTIKLQPDLNPEFQLFVRYSEELFHLTICFLGLTSRGFIGGSLGRIENLLFPHIRPAVNLWIGRQMTRFIDRPLARLLWHYFQIRLRSAELSSEFLATVRSAKDLDRAWVEEDGDAKCPVCFTNWQSPHTPFLFQCKNPIHGLCSECALNILETSSIRHCPLCRANACEEIYA